MKRSAMLAAIPLVLFLGFRGNLKHRLLEGPESTETVAVNGPAPEFVLEDLDGELFELAETAGENQLVIVNFWATWCGPCKLEMPQFQELYEEYGEQGMQLLAITNEDRETVQDFLSTKNYTFPILLDPDGTVSDQFGVSALPTTFFVSSAGRVTRIRQGVDPSMERQVRRRMGDAPDIPTPAEIMDSLAAMTEEERMRDARPSGDTASSGGGHE